MKAQPAKLHIRKPLPTCDGALLPTGTEVMLTDEWENMPHEKRARVVIDASGERRLVLNDDLEEALGAH